MRLHGLDLYSYTLTLCPAEQHQHNQLVAVRKPADIVFIPPSVVLVGEAVVEQRLRVCQRSEHPAVDVGKSGGDSADGFHAGIAHRLLWMPVWSCQTGQLWKGFCRHVWHSVKLFKCNGGLDVRSDSFRRYIPSGAEHSQLGRLGFSGSSSSTARIA